MSLNLAVILRERAGRSPDETALLAGEMRLTYGQVDRAAQRFAGALRRLGVDGGGHVAIMLPNVPHFSFAYFGAFYAGSVAVPLDTGLEVEGIVHCLEDSEARALVVWEDDLERARQAVARVGLCRHLILARRNMSDPSAPAGAVSLAALMAGAAPVTDPPATMPDDTAVILYGSGMVNEPVGVELTHFNLLLNAEVACTRLLPLDEDAVALAVLPFSRAFGQTVLHNAVLMSGGTIVLLPRAEVAAVLQSIHQHRVTFFAGTAAMYSALLSHPEAGAYDLGSLRCGVSVGPSVPPQVWRAFEHKHDVTVLEGYGTAETSPLVCHDRPGRPKKPGSVGVPIWGVQVRLEDEQGRAVETPGAPGEMVVKGHNVMKRYYKRPDVTARVLRDGWLHTGQLATRDADGDYFLTSVQDRSASSR